MPLSTTVGMLWRRVRVDTHRDGTPANGAAPDPPRRRRHHRPPPSSAAAARDVLLTRRAADAKFGLWLDEGNTVLRVLPGCRASRPLRRGDWVVAVNGVRLRPPLDTLTGYLDDGYASAQMVVTVVPDAARWRWEGEDQEPSPCVGRRRRWAWERR